MSNKILFIAPSNSVHSHKWINYFAKNTSLKLTWISFYPTDIGLRIGNNIQYHDLSKNNILSNFLFIRKLLKQENFSLIHLHYIGKFSHLLLLLRIKKLIVTPWGSDIKFLKNKSIKYFLTKKLLEKSSLITVDANYMVDIINNISTKTKNIKRINFGTDTSFFLPNNQKKDQKFRIISLRNLEKIYSIDTLIEAANILKNTFQTEIIIDIYGDGKEKENLQNLINKLALNNFVFLKGRYKYDNLPEILNKYHIYVSTSTSDAGLAASTSEAMSCGIIPLVSDNSENSFWMSKNCGFLFKTFSHNELANKIIEIISLTEEQKSIIQTNTRNKIIELNSFENEMSKMYNSYK